MNQMDIQFKALVNNISNEGTLVADRTGVGRIKIPGASLSFDLREGFPQLALRNIPYYKGWNEMFAFLAAATNASEFRERGVDYWDANANETPSWVNNPFRNGTDDLGPIYGKNWRKWGSYYKLKNDINDLKYAVRYTKLIKSGYVKKFEDKSGDILFYKEIDQFATCVHTILNNPGSSRILFHAWNVGELEFMALPPCHLLYQFIPINNVLNMNLYIRSADVILGTPTNVSQAAFLLTLVSMMTNMTPGKLNVTLGDAHIYANHIESIKLFIDQEVTDKVDIEYLGPINKYSIPASASIDDISKLVDTMITGQVQDDFQLVNYNPRIKIPRSVFPMAV